jgi:hypothetical protein
LKEPENGDQRNWCIDKPSTIVAEKNSKKMWMEKMESFLTILINKPMTGSVMPDDQWDGEKEN